MTARLGTIATGITGGLSASARSGLDADATFSATGSFAPQAYVSVRAVVSWAEFEAVQGVTYQVGAATLNGAGNLSAYVNLNAQITVSYAGSGNLSANVTSAQVAAVRFIGTGSLQSDSSKYKLAAVTFSGLGNLTADSSKSKLAAVTFTGFGNLNADSSKSKSAQATFAGIGNFSADSSVVTSGTVQQGSATFAGLGNLSSRANLNAQIAARFGTVSASVLLHMDSDFADATGRHTFTAQGNAQIDTGFGIIGSGSGLFDGTGDYLSCPDADLSDFNFGTGDFTVDVFIRAAAFGPSNNVIIDMGGGDVDNAPNWFLATNSSGAIFFFANQALAIPGITLSINTNYQITVERFNGTTKLFVNGAAVGSPYADSNAYVTPGYINIGAADGAFTWNGRLDELRIIRYPVYRGQNFTTATTPFDTTISSGSLSPSINQNLAASTRFAGAGNLSSDARRVSQISAFLIGTGNLSVSARLGQNAAATFSGAGSLRTYANLNAQIAATFGGQGNLNGFATITGATNAWSGEARFAGAGNVSVSTTQANQAAAIFGGLGSLSAITQRTGTLAVTYAGAGNLTAFATLGQAIAARLNGVGSLSAFSSLQLQIAATLNGIGNLSAFATVTGAANQWQGSATFSGIGALSAATVSQQQAQARFTGTANLSADSIKYKVGSATFGGVGNLSVVYSIVKYGQVFFAGSSDLRVGTTSRMQTGAIFGGQGYLYAAVTGGTGPRSPTRTGISGETTAIRAAGAVPQRPDQFQTMRRQKKTHG